MTSFYSGKKVFIAGGAGLIGQALIRKLVPMGARVTATEYRTRRIDPAYRNQVTVLCGHPPDYPFDLMKPGDCYRGQEIVFWCAARVGGARAIRENPSELIHYNLELASRNIKAAVDAGVERFCFTSSSYVYPDLDRPAEEQDVLAGDVPVIHYGLGWVKRYLETLCFHHHMTSKMRFAVIRPTAIYGPHDDFNLETCHVLPAVVRKLVEGPHPTELWGDGSEKRQWTYVDDLADGMLRVTADYCVGTPLNVCAREVETVRYLAAVARRIVFNTDKPDTAYYKFTNAGPRAIGSRLSNPSRARLLLGIKCNTTLEDGLRKTIDWYRASRVEKAH